MTRQCLSRRIESINKLREELSAWEAERNAVAAKVNWQFKTVDARVKLSSLYPKFTTASKQEVVVMLNINVPAHQCFCLLKFSHLKILNILAQQYCNSGILSTDVPDVDTGIDWLGYLAQNSRQCQAQSRFTVRSRLDIVVNSEIIVNPIKHLLRYSMTGLQAILNRNIQIPQIHTEELFFQIILLSIININFVDLGINFSLPILEYLEKSQSRILQI